MKKYIFICLFAFLGQYLHAQDESQTEYNFLRLPVSAHAAAMGGDNITMTDDDAGMAFNNPALIIGVTPRTVGLQYMRYMAGCNNASAMYNDVIDGKWNIGAGIQYMGYGSMKHRDEHNYDLGTFSANDIAISAVLGYELAKNFAGGIRLKYLIGTIGGYTSMAVAADLGLSWYLPESEWSFGLVMKNLGGQVKAYDENFERMPLDVQLGVSKHFVGSPLHLSLTFVDLNHPSYKFINHVVVGAEVDLGSNIYLAAGYNFRRASEMQFSDSDGVTSSHGAGLSFGGGINMERFKVNIAYGKYHLSSAGIVANLAFGL